MKEVVGKMDWKMIESIMIGMIIGLEIWYRRHPKEYGKDIFSKTKKDDDPLKDSKTYVLNKEEKARYADILGSYNEHFDLKNGFMIMNKGKPYVYINGAFVPVKEEEPPLKKAMKEMWYGQPIVQNVYINESGRPKE